MLKLVLMQGPFRLAGLDVGLSTNSTGPHPRHLNATIGGGIAYLLDSQSHQTWTYRTYWNMVSIIPSLLVRWIT